MITRSNIAEFFEQYKRNLEREEALNEAVLDAEDQEVWMENLRAKSRGLRQIYVENEALLNLYLRPFLEQESRLTKELAAEFLKGLVDLGEQGVCDRLVCIRTGKLLRRFFEKENDRDSLLITVHVLGNFYSQFSMQKDYEDAAACFDVERKQLEHYAQIEDWNVRRRVLFAFYNYAVILVNGRQCYEKEQETSYRHQYDIIRAADEAIAAYDNPVVRSMDGDKYDLDGLKEELLYDVFGNWICGCDQRNDMIPEMLERCCRLLDGLYQNALKESLQAHPGKGEDSLEVACGIQDEIYCNYWKAKVYLEKIGLEEYLHKMMEYFEVTRNDFGEETTAIVDSRGYQINMYHLVNLAGTPGLAEHTELLEKVGQFILPRFTEFVEKLPRNDRATFVNGTVRNALMELFRTLGTKHVETVVLLSHKKADSYIHIDVEFGEGEGKIPVDSIAKRAEAYKPKEKVTYKMIKEYIEAKYGFKVHTAYIAEVKRNLGLPMYDAPNAVEELKQPRKHPTPEKVEAIKDALRYFAVI